MFDFSVILSELSSNVVHVFDRKFVPIEARVALCPALQPLCPESRAGSNEPDRVTSRTFGRAHQSSSLPHGGPS